MKGFGLENLMYILRKGVTAKFYFVEVSNTLWNIRYVGVKGVRVKRCHH